MSERLVLKGSRPRLRPAWRFAIIVGILSPPAIVVSAFALPSIVGCIGLSWSILAVISAIVAMAAGPIGQSFFTSDPTWDELAARCARAETENLRLEEENSKMVKALVEPK